MSLRNVANLMFAGGVAVLGAVIAVGSATGARASELILNGGFEDGSTTVGGDTVPNDWIPNAGFVCCGYGQVVTGPVHSGSFALQIGNFDYQALAALSQTFADVNGASYSGSIWVDYSTSYPTAFFEVLVDGTPVVNLSGAAGAGGPYEPYTEFTFSFTGTGSDTLTIEAQTNPGEWYADDVSVTGQGVGAAPLPAALPLFAGGLGVMGLFARRRKQKAAPTIAAA